MMKLLSRLTKLVSTLKNSMRDIVDSTISLVLIILDVTPSNLCCFQLTELHLLAASDSDVAQLKTCN